MEAGNRASPGERPMKPKGGTERVEREARPSKFSAPKPTSSEAESDPIPSENFRDTYAPPANCPQRLAELTAALRILEFPSSGGQTENFSSWASDINSRIASLNGEVPNYWDWHKDFRRNALGGEAAYGQRATAQTYIEEMIHIAEYRRLTKILPESLRDVTWALAETDPRLFLEGLLELITVKDGKVGVERRIRVLDEIWNGDFKAQRPNWNFSKSEDGEYFIYKLNHLTIVSDPDGRFLLTAGQPKKDADGFYVMSPPYLYPRLSRGQ